MSTDKAPMHYYAFSFGQSGVLIFTEDFEKVNEETIHGDFSHVLSLTKEQADNLTLSLMECIELAPDQIEDVRDMLSKMEIVAGLRQSA